MGELIDMYISPSSKGRVKECILGGAEYKGTIRISSSAIPFFRNIKTAFATVRKEAYEKGRKDGIDEGTTKIDVLKTIKQSRLDTLKLAKEAVEKGLDDWDKLTEGMDEENAVCYTINRIYRHLEEIEKMK